MGNLLLKSKLKICCCAEESFLSLFFRKWHRYATIMTLLSNYFCHLVCYF